MLVGLLSVWIVLVIILQIRKVKQDKGRGKLDKAIAFFHPFWYFC
jgi:hypothetical protein